jgi:N-acetylmuramate 1-kinase
MKNRAQDLKNWCSQQSLIKDQDFDFSMISGDASFRRYFRIQLTTISYIAVDAPPQHENSQQFCKVATLFAEHGVCVPQILAKDFVQGFMLLSDLGDRQLLAELNEQNAQRYYALAFKEIIKLQSAETHAGTLPLYDFEKLMQEMSLFQDWFTSSLLDLKLSDAEIKLIVETQNIIAERVLKQKQVYVHRDFHSRNLMIVEKNGETNMALIDFQDAVIGAITYDAVSLLKDCYIEWPAEKRKQFLENYYAQLHYAGIVSSGETFESFFQDFEIMGLQRHLKILGIFARLSIRDHKHSYLKDLPLTFKYIEETLLGFPEFKTFSDFFLVKVKSKFQSLSVFKI